MLNEGEVILHDRYTLVEKLSDNGGFCAWKARDVYGGPILIKAWPFQGDRPDEVQRALWDVELRHLFRLAGLPEAEDHLVVLKDAGVDKKAGYFVMALMAPGLSPLEALVLERTRCLWLRDLQRPAARAELWRGIKGLALGLIQVHSQHMLHRAISAESVLVEPTQGPSTMRLGGFEWTVRLGSDFSAPLLPPDEGAGVSSFESDWFLFGALAARLIAAAEPPVRGDPTEKHEDVLRQVREHGTLLDSERDLLQRLLTHDADARLVRGDDIVSRINDLLLSLDEPARPAENSYLALLALLGPQRPLTLAIIEQDEKINAISLEEQRKFIEQDLKDARLVRQPSGGREAYVLVGQRLRYYVTEHARDKEPATGAWDLAYCGNTAELRHSAGSDDQVAVDRLPIQVFTLSTFFRDENVVRRAAVPWKALLPRQNRGAANRERLERFHDFFRVTSQIELLMRDAEIFPYEIRSKRVVDGAEEVVLYERKTDRAPLDFAKMVEGLADFLNNQREEDKPDGDLVYLGAEPALNPARRVSRPEFWKLIDADVNGNIKLRRLLQKTKQDVPDKGYLRSFALFGQMSLVKRRRRAIEKLKNHAYLLQALQRPDFVQLDSGETELPRPIDSTKIDEAKTSAMSKIWRSRPIFALQGPPGTGKTTLVANLLGQIFEEDRVAQVLVTAQAHAAVDVLLEKVSKEVFHDGAAGELPISIRLPRKKDDDARDPYYLEQVTSKMLERAVRELQAEDARTPTQERWLNTAEGAVRALARGDLEDHAGDLCELVRRSAGITYSTTTAGNLAELANTTQTFDWSIIEETGKAHGFDLVLPLQTGHRWLLIGDQDQLKPYRFTDFWKALSKLDVVFAALKELPERAGGQLDMDLILRWQKYSDGEKEERQKLWRNWLSFFERLYETCFQVRTANGDTGALAEMLSRQHRMHPTIAELVSRAYYEGKITSGTRRDDGTLEPRVVHPFVEPAAIVGRAIVWLDVDWVNKGGTGERGQQQGSGRYTAPDEVEAVLRFIMALRAPAEAERMRLATLAPYRLQVFELNRALRDLERPWLRPQEEKGRKKKRSPASTVDSFQGDQADVVIVSLVRNNQRKDGLGFLRESERMNVLFSRAERLLVLVGSWDFFQHQLQGTSADPHQPLGKWRIALDYLDECFKNGKAVKLRVDSLPRLP